MPRPKKSLLERVQERTFEARREDHRALLATEPLLESPVLRAYQVRYRAEPDAFERRQIAGRFEVAVAAGAGDTLLTGEQHMYANIGPFWIGVPVKDGKVLRARADPLWKRFWAWDEQHGLLWRVQHGALATGELVELARRAGLDLTATEALKAEHELGEAAFTDEELASDVPDPPEWEAVLRGARPGAHPLWRRRWQEALAAGGASTKPKSTRAKKAKKSTKTAKKR